ncbi:DUF2225 domain-containing protein [Rubrobacter xylanophilus]|uniref:DUF2225 domain-containing protein n=1 Tax=Rubrobacter xylanophilus TaxID=49319 RepID=UPI001C63C3F9|nr:DUF2225 domain-containing protein [Rubrobacter xylanophilus]
MGEIRRVYTRCPLCGQIFRAAHAGSYITVGRDTDLCPRFPGRRFDAARLIRSEITMCPRCNFASAEDFRELDLTFDERYDLEERLREDGLLRIFRANQPPWLAFHAAEICGQERRLPARELGDLCLRASWVCRKAGERAFESTFQLRAVRYFMRALDNEELEGRRLPVTTYLVGELNRRLGHHREALNWYVNAERTMQAVGRMAWLDRLISRQSKLAREQAA